MSLKVLLEPKIVKNDLYKNMYGLTISLNTKKDPTTDDYKPALDKIRIKGDFHNIVFENMTKDHKPTKLHIHALVKFRRNILINSIRIYGFHLKFEPIYDQKGWTKYMFKNSRIDNTEYMF